MVNVIGLGYIGLPTALMLASHGINVVGSDYNENIVETLRSGQTTFKEKGMDELFRAPLRMEYNSRHLILTQIVISCPFQLHMINLARKLMPSML